jgi:hypothetical protein
MQRGTQHALKSCSTQPGGRPVLDATGPLESNFYDSEGVNFYLSIVEAVQHHGHIFNNSNICIVWGQGNGMEVS